MTRQSIGQFLATLRKEQGMTQQEVAEYLHVSNKAISRWEREECLPDLSIIPTIAELFGVTCDELLKGERFSTQVEEKEQGKENLNGTILTFKTYFWISLAVAVMGYICMLGITFGFSKPIIGFTVMLLLETCSLTMALLAVVRAKNSKQNIQPKGIEEELISHFNDVVGRGSWYNFYVISAAILCALPFLFIPFDKVYVHSASTSVRYVFFFIAIGVLLAIIHIQGKYAYISWITGRRLSEKACIPIKKLKRKLSLIQCGLIAFASLIFVFAPYFDEEKHESLYYDGANVIGLIVLLTNVIYCAIFLFVHKKQIKSLLLTGLRNIALSITAFILVGVHEGVWIFREGKWIRHSSWDFYYLGYAVVYIAIVFLLFALIEILIKRIGRKTKK